MDKNPAYIEIAKFKLKAGFSDEQFIEAELAVRNGMIKSQKSFINRELCKDAEGNWMIDMRFETKADMEAWFVALKQDPTMKTYGSMIDFQSMRSEFFDKKI
jgi:heme-degrading monooxygenase HmoA